MPSRLLRETTPLKWLGEAVLKPRTPKGLLFVALLLVGCAHEEGRGPLTEDKMNPLAQNQGQSTEARIKAIQDNPNMPAPEKERAIRIIQTQASVPATGQK